MTTAQSAAVDECVDDALYVVMRLARTLVALVLEAGMIFSIFAAFMSPLVALLGENTHNVKPIWLTVTSPEHWVLSTLFWVGMVILCFAVLVAVSTPYRYAVVKPGLNVRTCGTCGVNIANAWRCSNCKEFRPAWVVSMVILALSAIITVFCFTHDLLAILWGSTRK